MTLLLRLFAVFGLVLAAACAGAVTTQPLLTGPDTPIEVRTRAVVLGAFGADLAPGVRYAGGLALSGNGLHGLSDLKIEGDRAWMVSDFGGLVRFTIRTDASGRLSGVQDVVQRALVDTNGLPLQPKSRADAEGLALLDDGRLLVSFEREHRIWSYGRAPDARPLPVRAPDVVFPDNQGMEGLAAAPDGGWLVLGESGGAWVCAASACRALANAPSAPADGYAWTGVDRDPAGGWFVVERSYSPPVDMRMRIRRMAPDGTVGPVLIALRQPATVDNFEGIAAVATPTGTRLYVLSDDNANGVQKTLLLAFDIGV